MVLSTSCLPYAAAIYAMSAFENVFGFADYTECRVGQLSVEEREFCTQLEQTLQTLTEQARMKKRVELICCKSFESGACAIGTEVLPGRCQIVFGVGKAMKEHWTSAECEFIMGHELAHIRNNDALFRAALPLAASVVAHVALGILCPIAAPATFALFDISFLLGSTLLLSRRQEVRADKESFLSISREGKDAVPSFFQKWMALNQCQSFFGKVGIFFHELSHTSLSSRRANIIAMNQHVS